MAAVKVQRISLLTYSSLMNNTVNNQGDHCMVAHDMNGKCIGNDTNQTLLTPSEVKQCPSADNESALGPLYEFAKKWFE